MTVKTSKGYMVEGQYIPKDTQIKIIEKLTLDDFQSASVYAGNDHVNKFYNGMVGEMGKNAQKYVKLVDAYYDKINDVVRFSFLTEVTTGYPKEHDYKELDVDVKNYNSKSAKYLQPNSSKTYEMYFEVIDAIETLKELQIEDAENFRKEDMIALMELSYMKVYCNCPSFQYTGVNYYLSKEDGSIKPTNIAPTVWDKYRKDALVCKHLSGLLHPNTIKFMANILAQKFKSLMIKNNVMAKKKKK